MNDRERWLVGAICFLFLFGSAADWYKKSRSAGLPGRFISPDRAAAQQQIDSTVPSGPVDLNRCGESELVRLSGIGPVRAKSIVRWREENGPFDRVEDLERVPGIGPATVERLRGELLVREPSSGGERGEEEAE